MKPPTLTLCIVIRFPFSTTFVALATDISSQLTSSPHRHSTKSLHSKASVTDFLGPPICEDTEEGFRSCSLSSAAISIISLVLARSPPST